MKKILSLFCIITLTLSLSVGAYQIQGLENFEYTLAYEENTFSDIHSDDWYFQNVVSVYRYGLMSGNGNGIFAPLQTFR